MTTTAGTTTPDTTERIHAHHTSIKRLGHWTTADTFDVRARHSAVVLDLRSPSVPGDVEIHLDLQRAMVKLLVPEDAVVEHWDLGWTARGRVKDATAPTGTATRRIRLIGTAENSEVRVNRGGVAIVSAMLSREYLEDLRAARREHRHPTVDDPSRES